MLGIFRMKFFAFYWTLPVPWAGFDQLPEDIDAAAEASRTIRYCRNLVQAHVRARGGRIIPGGEVARMELAPDRGSPELAAEFCALLDRAAAMGARVAIVDFSGHRGWRGHQHLAPLYGHPACEVIPAAPEDVHLAGFNPYDHFEAWRDRTKAQIADKPDHRSRIMAALAEIDATSFAARAKTLNALDLRTHTGKTWTAENLRKFMKAGQDDSPS